MGILIVRLRLVLTLVLTGPAIASARHHPTSRTTINWVSEEDALKYVDPLIGSLNGGHVFSGATMPFGSVKAVGDVQATDDGGGNQAGFVSNDARIFGFSQLHDSGTGGSASLGNFGIMPMFCEYLQAGSGAEGACPLNPFERMVHRAPGSTVARPGYFGITLENGIKAEVTVTRRTALYRFDFSQAKAKPTRTMTSARSHKRAHSKLVAPHHLQHGKPGPVLLFDLVTDLIGTSGYSSSLNVTHDEDTGVATVRGTTSSRPSFGDGFFKVHACLSVANVTSAGVWMGNTFRDGERHLNDPGDASGALFQFDPDVTTAQARIGVSWTSPDKACEAAQEEMPSWEEERSFEAHHKAASTAWGRMLTGSLSVDATGVKKEHLTRFYSSLYRTFISPTNVTGDLPHADSQGPEYDSFYCLWDEARVKSSLYAVLDPALQSELIQGLMAIYRREGYLPDCHMAMSKGFVQGGSWADTLLADSFVKMVGAHLDWGEILTAMLKNAEVDPPDWGLQGRGGIAARKKLGYVPYDGEGNSPDGPRVVPGRTVSRTIEYAYNDFGIALVAAGLGNWSLAQDFRKRSQDGLNLWNQKQVSDQYVGFLDSRLSNGSFTHAEDPRKCSPVHRPNDCYLMRYDEEPQFYEGSSWMYSFLAAPTDMRRVILLMGGSKVFIDRLDHGWDSRYLDVSDEQGFLPQFLYNFAIGGYPSTVDRVRSTMDRYYNTTLAGIPGNDDNGSQGAFVVWATMGMFPLAGTDIYLLSAPMLPRYQVVSGVTGKIATVIAKNFDGEGKNKYIVNATFNGSPFKRNWIGHRELFLDGGTLEVTLGSESSEFGTSRMDLPPNLSSGGFDQALGQTAFIERERDLRWAGQRAREWPLNAAI